jgi:peptide deformylase
MKLRLIVLIETILVLASCQSNRLTISEKKLIKSGTVDSTMYVLSVFKQNDSLVLRKVSAPMIKPDNRLSELLIKRMLATVLHPGSRGVGIAAPQVGISRRLILVQRFDKEEEPFESYFNPVILSYSPETITRDEGCLSIPGYRGPVERPNSIELSYMNSQGETITEIVEGFTARIFQHEIDHLNGVLYTDLLEADSLLRVVNE